MEGHQASNGYNNSVMSNGPQTPFDFHSSASDFVPLNIHHSIPINPNTVMSTSHLDPLVAMEKSLSQHESQMGSGFSSSDLTRSTSRTPSSSNNNSITNNSPGHNNQSTTSPRTNIGPKTPQTPAAPHTPLTPGTSNVGTPISGGAGNTPNRSSDHHSMNNVSTNPSSTNDLNDLNFDPAAVIDGEGQGQEGLNVRFLLSFISTFLSSSFLSLSLKTWNE